MSVPDRDQVAEALAYWDQIERTEPRRVSLTWEQLDDLLFAAREWLGLEGALVIQRDDNGELIGIEPAQERLDAMIDNLLPAGQGLIIDLGFLLDALSVEGDQEGNGE